MNNHSLEVVAINYGFGSAVLSDGQELPITTWIDDDGDDCEVNDAVSGVAGPDKSGNCHSFICSHFSADNVN